jgi:outer membrane protein assembly factor BamB
LRLGWATTLPLEGNRDGIATIQLFESLLVVQLRSGLVSAHDAESGTQAWSVRPGGTFPPLIPEACSDNRFIIVIRDVRMYGINRSTGKLEWTFEMPTIPSSAPTSDGERVYVCIGGDRLIAYGLPARPDSEKVVTEGLFVTSKQKPTVARNAQDSKTATERRIEKPSAFRDNQIRTSQSVAGSTSTTPSIAVLESVNPPYRVNSNQRQLTASLAVLPSAVPPFRINSDVSATPAMTMLNNITRLEEMSQKSTPPKVLTQRWALTTGVRLPHAPRVTSGGVVVTSSARTIIASPKLAAQEFYRFETGNNITGPASQFGDSLFVSTIDSSLYALDGLRGRVLWRFTGNGPAAQPAIIIGDEVFLTTIQHELHRLDRASGESMWRDKRGVLDRSAPEVDRVVAVNDKVIFAKNTMGDLVALDRRRGLPLGSVQTREFTFAFANSTTDRVYLSAHNGLLICLHDRDNSRPVLHPQRDANTPVAESQPEVKPVERPKKPLPGKPPEEKPKEEKPKEEKPKEEKKDS